MNHYKNPVCRGSWALGSACGVCERCIELKPKDNMSQPNEASIYAPDYLRAQDDKQLHLIADTMEHLIQSNQKLRDELSFVQQYLNPADTSFRQMIDAFRVLPKEKQDKLIDLSASLVALNEVE